MDKQYIMDKQCKCIEMDYWKNKCYSMVDLIETQNSRIKNLLEIIKNNSPVMCCKCFNHDKLKILLEQQKNLLNLQKNKIEKLQDDLMYLT